MIENYWIAEQERYDDECAEWDEKHNHWEHDRGRELVLDFIDDKELKHKALAMFLNVDEDEIDYDNGVMVFEYLPYSKQAAIAEEYIEFAQMQDDFNEWFDDRYGDPELDHASDAWKDQIDF